MKIDLHVIWKHGNFDEWNEVDSIFRDGHILVINYPNEVHYLNLLETKTVMVSNNETLAC
jgi:hypothetical protein